MRRVLWLRIIVFYIYLPLLMKQFVIPALTCCFIFFFNLTASNAQIPRLLNYQGALNDNSGKPVADGSHSVTFNLYRSLAGGASLYSETQTIQVTKGIFSATIGSQTVIPVSIKFDSGYFLGIAIDGGTELTPRTQLTSSPYALNAAFASTAGFATVAATSVLAAKAGVADSANALSSGVNGVVRTVNAHSGDIIIQGTGATKVTTIGSTISISIPPGTGNGIQGVINGDSSIV